MDSSFNSYSEINSKNKYKFDNYGIVMADTIEDLLYDKYNRGKKRKKKQQNNYSNSDLYEDNEDNDEESTSSYKESRFYDISISHNIDLKFIQNNKNNSNLNIKKSYKKNQDKHNNSKNENYSKNNKHKKNDNKNDIKDESIKRDNKSKNWEKEQSYKIKDNHNQNNRKKKYFKPKYLKMERNKGVEINSNKINKEKEKRSKIRIIFNINNKQKKEVELDPDSSSVKNIIINADKKSNASNNEKEKEEFLSNDNSSKINNKNKNKIKYLEDNINCKSINKIKMFFKKSDSEIKNDSNDNNDHKNTIDNKENDKINKSNMNLKKIHLVASERNIMSNINKKRKNTFHNMPISSQCYIYKTRKEPNFGLNKIIPKKERMFITKAYIKKKKHYNIKIVTLPNSTMCYFYKDQKIINVRTHIPLQNVVNNNYFCTKETCSVNEELRRKQLMQKYGENNTEISSEIQAKEKIGDNVHTDLEGDSPDIVIKIINPINKSYKYGKINIKTHSPSFIKSKSCQKIRSNNKSDIDKKSYLINIIREKNNNILPLRISGKKKIKKLKKANTRYERNNAESSNFKCIKNKEIINALNTSDKNKIQSPACITLNKRREFAEKLRKSLKMRNKNKINNKNEKNIKIKSLKSEFNHNLKKKLIFSHYEEEKIGKNRLKKNIKKIDSKFKLNNFIFSKTKNPNDSNFNIINNVKPSYNASNVSLNKNLSNNYIEFPAIDSYFH
jgi:hypothetical protein